MIKLSHMIKPLTINNAVCLYILQERRMLKILLAGLGGFAGAVLRYLTYSLSNRLFSEQFFPYGTLAVNVAGCLFIGFLGAFFETKTFVLSPEIRILIITGFLGGFTTYSTFGYEVLTLVRSGHTAAAVSNLVLHLILGLGAVWLGFISYRFL